MTVKTRSALLTQADNTLEDNATRSISAGDLRQMVKDVADSVRLLQDIIGTVSQSGGIPTGAIFQSGSNANGSFTRFADGSLICTHSAKAVYNAAVRLRYSWTFPSPFLASNAYTWSAMVQTRNPTNTVDNQGLSAAAQNGMVIEAAHDQNLITVDVYNPSSPFVTGDFVWLSLIAKGNWFV